MQSYGNVKCKIHKRQPDRHTHTLLALLCLASSQANVSPDSANIYSVCCHGKYRVLQDKSTIPASLTTKHIRPHPSNQSAITLIHTHAHSHLFLSELSVSSTSSALHVALESLSWAPLFPPCSFFLTSFLPSSTSRAGGFLSSPAASLPHSPGSIFTSCFTPPCSTPPFSTFGFSSGPISVAAMSLSVEDEEEVALDAVLGRAEPSSLTLLSSEERGEGRLSCLSCYWLHLKK